MSSRLETNIRIALAVAGFLSALVLPSYVPLACMVLLAIRFPAWEVPLIGLTIDLMWLPMAGFALPMYTIAGVAIVWLLAPLRKRFLI